MTATLGINAQDMDWRSRGLCEPEDTHFDSRDDLLEEGIDPTLADVMVSRSEAEAKQICEICPVKQDCAEFALSNDEQYGVWGGMTEAERLAQRPVWLQIKGFVSSSGIEDTSQLHPNPAINKKYQDRLRRAREARDLLMSKPGFELDLGSYLGSHDHGECMKVVNLVLRNPSLKADELAPQMDRKATWFNVVLRELFSTLGV
ncbi:WhiB family transcriptional regulator [Mycolicibacterium palauense]|uniref:WhiB family transcriptional regulator n=1 Tax=Mycolicibacterium palauense TaxID=2034511 RepID=UPI00114528D1|nr:WhiB family transcriptional regulator [Mycolicibacterium palauense]